MWYLIVSIPDLCNLTYFTYIKSTFSEYGHVAYQIKGNEACNNMLANSLVLHLPLTPGMGQRVNFFSFLKEVMLYIKLI